MMIYGPSQQGGPGHITWLGLCLVSTLDWAPPNRAVSAPSACSTIRVYTFVYFLYFSPSPDIFSTEPCAANF